MLWCVLFLPWLAWGHVQISGTRVIYPANAREVTLELTNKGSTPSLVQVWIDAGDRRIRPGAEALPFLVTPPITRIEAQRGQSLRLAYLGQGLPQDRQSVFWLNVLEVPPSVKSTQVGQNLVQLAFRSRIKMFYRPSGLAGSPAEAVSRLGWQGLEGGGLRVSNPGPFHINLSEVLLSGPHLAWREGGVLPPYGSLSLPMAGAVPAGARGRLRWIDDDGNYHEQGFVLSRHVGERDE
ncbi:molecular chaperone [Aeromonas media]|uniref:fimbrial biogenesis chaperone n=1 Tax=Aeromonas media TaxID=651 RepID=UPI003D056E40